MTLDEGTSGNLIKDLYSVGISNLSRSVGFWRVILRNWSCLWTFFFSPLYSSGFFHFGCFRGRYKIRKVGWIWPYRHHSHAHSQPYTVGIGSRAMQRYLLLQFPCWEFLLTFSKGCQGTWDGHLWSSDRCCQEEDRCQVHSRARKRANPLIRSKSLIPRPPSVHWTFIRDYLDTSLAG